jgi:hypothetical protein
LFQDRNIGIGVFCRQRKRVRFTTAAQLVNALTEAKNKSELNRVTNRWTQYELIVIDEMAYVALPEAAAELLLKNSGRACKPDSPYTSLLSATSAESTNPIHQ